MTQLYFSNKRILLSFLISGFISSFTYGQTGSQEQPLSIAEALKKSDSSPQTYWISGYVVGEMKEYSNNKYIYEVAPPFVGKKALLLADSNNEYDIKNCMVIEIPDDAYQNGLSLDENPAIWKKKFTVNGLLRSYFTLPGIRNIKEHEFESFDPANNEVGLWNFYEDMDSKDYSPQNNNSTFAGGIYKGDTGTWLLKGATIGESGKDTKWGRSSVRMRLTEGTTGNKGSLELLSDKENGLGEIRFWAGNYEDDAAKLLAFSVFYSLDEGKNWITVASDHAVKRGNKVTTNNMSEYRFFVNQPGKGRIKITKADPTTGSINIDNIRISDFKTPTGLDLIQEKPTWGHGIKGGIRITTDKEMILSLYSVSGHLIRSIDTTQPTDFIPVPAGIYFLHSSFGTTKIIVQ
ncbi:MAG: DUF6359 domain-containing protein [Bacteroidales bacterium]